MSSQLILCKVCNRFELENAKIYRLGPVLPIIGWIILAPCIIGMGLGLILVLGLLSESAAIKPDRAPQIAQPLVNAGVNPVIIDDFTEGKFLSTKERQSLPVKQRQVYNEAALTYSTETLGRHGVKSIGIVGGACIFASTFFLGIMGWIFTLKKKVLMCPNCKATIDTA